MVKTIDIKKGNRKIQALTINGLCDKLSKEGSHIRLKKAIIVKTVCEYYDITEQELKSKCRAAKFRYPRQICIYICKSIFLSQISLSQLGQDFNVDHATVLHCMKKINDGIEFNESTRRDLLNLLGTLNGLCANKDEVFDANSLHFIDMNNCISSQTGDGRAIIYVNYSETEIKKLNPKSPPLFFHKDTNINLSLF